MRTSYLLTHVAITTLALSAATAAGRVDQPFAGRVAYANDVFYGRTTLHVLQWPSGVVVDLPDATSNVNNRPQWIGPDATGILFHAGFGAANIWRVNSDGTGLTQLTTGGDDHVNPSGSPLGTEFVFNNNIPELRIRRIDGTGEIVITGGHSPKWSPGGTEVAFAANNGDLMIWDLVRSEGRIVVDAADGEFFSEPDWSGDGGRLLATRRVGTATDVVVMDSDGANYSSLTSEMVDSEEDGPCWSHDDAHIVFAARPSSGGKRDLWVMRPDGAGKSRLTDTPGVDEQVPDVAPPLVCPGDYDENWITDVADIFAFLTAWFAGCP